MALKVEIENELILDIVSFNELNVFIKKMKKNGVKGDDMVRVYIDSTGTYDYLEALEGIDKSFGWCVSDFDARFGHYIVKAKLDDVIKHIHAYSD